MGGIGCAFRFVVIVAHQVRHSIDGANFMIVVYASSGRGIDSVGCGVFYWGLGAYCFLWSVFYFFLTCCCLFVSFMIVALYIIGIVPPPSCFWP